MNSPQQEKTQSLKKENTDPLNDNSSIISTENTTKMVKLDLVSNTFPNQQTSKIRQIVEKERTQKKIAQTDQWRILSQYLEHEHQMELMNDVYRMCIGENVVLGDKNRELCIKTMYRQIHEKNAGYKYQDIAKKIYDDNAFISLNQTIQLLVHSSLKCFYCDEGVKVLYEHVKDEKQWSLERIDNSMGHNVGNVEIACLRCNLRRRTMYHERYLDTKRLKFVKVEHS